MPRKISQQTFWFERFSKKKVIFNQLLMIIMSLIHFFIKQIFRAPEKATPPPHSAVQGAGQMWLFSARNSKFGSGFEALKIRVKGVLYVRRIECIFCRTTRHKVSNLQGVLRVLHL
jgi:hypothetical protein